MLMIGLVLIGYHAYVEAGPDAVKYAIESSLYKLLIQVPAGIIAVWIASRLIDFDFGTIGVIAMRIAAITVLAEGVADWIPVDRLGSFGPFFAFMAELTVMLIGFFILFELTKWQTYLIVLLNFVVLFGAHYVLANYINKSHSFGARPAYRGRRQVGERPNRARPAGVGTEGLIRIE
jgi:hypothetical protein